MLRPSDLEAVVVAPAPLPEALSAWVLELGEASRRAELRSGLYKEQGQRLKAWSSRREAVRTRRRLVQALVAGKVAFEPADAPVEPPALKRGAPVARPPVIAELSEGSVEELPSPQPLVEEPEAAGLALADRIAAYLSPR